MSARNHTRLERLLAGALLLAMVAAAGAAVAPATLGRYTAGEEEIAGLRARYAELMRRQRDIGALEQRRDALRASDPQQFGLLVADTVELARAEMQGMIERFAAETGATIAQVRAIERDDPSVAAAGVSLRIPSEGLPGFLLQVAGAEPLLFIDSIDIRSDLRRRRVEGPEVLSVDMDLSAYISVPVQGQGQ